MKALSKKKTENSVDRSVDVKQERYKIRLHTLLAAGTQRCLALTAGATQD
jgi:hypothetical protein